tara:strand:- start:26202 stop:26900 length:699 start_codon:yes stop_codon:yes gene_type:complete
MDIIDTTANYPAYAEDIAASSLQSEENMHRLNNVSQILEDYPPFIITDAEGNKWEILAKPAGTGLVITSSVSWNLSAVPDVAGTYSILPGVIYEHPTRLDAEILIFDDDLTFSPEVGNAVWLEVTQIGTTVDGEPIQPFITLTYGPEWEGFPSVFDWDETGDAPTLTKARFALWNFLPGELPEGTPGTELEGVGGTFYGRRWERSFDLGIDYIPAEVNNTGYIATGINLFPI